MNWLKSSAFVVPGSLGFGILAFAAATILQVSVSTLLAVPFRAEFWALPNMVIAGIATAVALRFLRKRQSSAGSGVREHDGINSRAARRRAQRAARSKAQIDQG